MIRNKTKDPVDDSTPSDFSIGGFSLVEFDRRPLESGLLRGFRVRWNADLTLLHILENETFSLNGYAVLRNRDIRRWRLIPKDAFMARAALKKRLRPVDPSHISISSIKEVMRSAGESLPLLTIHRERIKKNACCIGVYMKSTQRAVTLRDIGPDVEWGGLDTYAYRDMTMIEFGGAYETLLIRLASPPPIAAPRRRGAQ